VPADSRGNLSSGRLAGQAAAESGAGRLVLTHLMPGTDRQAAVAAARAGYGGQIQVAEPGLVCGPG
jgi:ribonuclease BN (tRNA processing enzyme)